MRINTALFLSLCLANACGKKSTDSSSNDASTASPTAPFFTLSDITPGSSLQSLTQAEMQSSLEGESDVYNNEPSSKASLNAAQTDSCLSKINEIPVQSTKTTITVAAKLNLSCTEATGGTNIELTGTAKIYLQIVCSSDDLSSFNGKKLGDITTSNDIKCSSGTIVSNTLVDMSSKITASGKSITINLKNFMFDGKSDLSPCSIKTGKTYGNDCISSYKITTTTPQLGLEDQKLDSYTKFTYNNITNEDSNTALWHSGGSMGFTTNNWTGTLTYTNSATAPTYKASADGASAVEGTLSPSAGLNLFHKMNRKISAMLTNI